MFHHVVDIHQDNKPTEKPRRPTPLSPKTSKLSLRKKNSNLSPSHRMRQNKLKQFTSEKRDSSLQFMNFVLPKQFPVSHRVKKELNYTPEQTVSGSWNGWESDGQLSPRNPQIAFEITSQSFVNVRVERTDELYEIGHLFYICTGDGKRTMMNQSDILFQSEIVDSSVDVDAHVELKKGSYVIVCCLYDFEGRKGVSASFSVHLQTAVWGCLSRFELLPSFQRQVVHGVFQKPSKTPLSFENQQIYLEISEPMSVLINLDSKDKPSDQTMKFFVIKAVSPKKKRFSVGEKDNLVYISLESKTAFDVRLQFPTSGSYLIIPSASVEGASFTLTVEYSQPHSKGLECLEALPNSNGSDLNESDCMEILKQFQTSEIDLWFDKNPVPEIIQYCEENNCYFKDSKFPPINDSVQRHPDDRKLFDDFKRVGNFLDSPNVIIDGVDVQDVQQGNLNDGLLLQAYAACSLHPDRIRDLFYPLSYSPRGIYSVKLYIEDKWQYVVIDDYFPCLDGHQAFAHGSDPGELHVMLFEKAFAKILGSYANLEKIESMQESFVKLTGGDTLVEYLSSLENEQDHQNLWTQMAEYSRNGWLITAVTRPKRPYYLGLVDDHAYVIVDTWEDRNHQYPALLRLYNIQGSGEWKGDFSDSSECWSKELKKRLDVQEIDDGLFWMCYEDFFEHFSKVCFCKVLSREHTFSYQVKGTWEKNWGPFGKEGKNPKFLLKLLHPGITKLIITLTRRGELPGHSEMKFLITKGSMNNPIIEKKDVVYESRTRQSVRMLVEISLRCDFYCIVPCCSAKGQETFTVSVRSDKKLEFGQPYSDPWPYTYYIEGKWDPQGGFQSFNNPKIGFKVLQECDIRVVFRRTDNKKPSPTSLYLLHGHGKLSSNDGTIMDKFILHQTIDVNNPIFHHVKADPAKYFVVCSMENRIPAAMFKLKIQCSHRLSKVRGPGFELIEDHSFK